MIEALLSLIAPHDCLGCGVEGELLCALCAAACRTPASLCYRCQQPTIGFRTCQPCRKSSALHTVVPFTLYEGAPKNLVWNLKFGRAKAAARTIARHLPMKAEDTNTVLVFVPTATSRVRQRGYDQARLIARELGRLHRIPLLPALVRVGQRRQVGASGEQRRRQLQDAFRVVRKPTLKGKHVVLVDDVVTSGATLEAAARVLHQAGAQRIDAAVFARA